MFKRGEIVIKVIETPWGNHIVRTATILRLERTNSEFYVAWTGDGESTDSVDAYDLRTGEAMQNYIPGCVSYLVHLDEGQEELIQLEPPLYVAPPRTRKTKTTKAVARKAAKRKKTPTKRAIR